MSLVVDVLDRVKIEAEAGVVSTMPSETGPALDLHLCRDGECALNADPLEAIEYDDLMTTREQLEDLGKRIGALEGKSPNSFVAPSDSAPAWVLWLKGNWVPVTSLVFGSGAIWAFFTFVFGTLVDNRIQDKLAAPTKSLQDQGLLLSEMKGKVDTILALMQLRASATLPKAQFNQKLGEVRNALEVMGSQQDKRSLDEPSLNAIRDRILDADNTLRDYWPATAALVRLRSPSLPLTLPPCNVHDYGPELFKVDPSESTAPAA